MDYYISEEDLFLFHQGTNYYSQKLLGCHPNRMGREKWLSLWGVGAECQ